MVILVFFLLVSGYVYYSGRSLNNLYGNMVERQFMLNSLFINLGITNDLLEKYLLTKDPKLLDDFNKTYPLLFETTANFEKTQTNSKQIRKATDLKYMVQTYIEEANSSIAFLKEHKNEESFKKYYEAKKVFQLINEYFQNVFSGLLEDDRQVKLRIIDEKILFYTLNIFLILFTAIFGLVLIQRFSISITNPIKRLTIAATKISEGEIDIDETLITSQDEVGILTKVFNNMAKRINSQIAEIKSKVQVEKRLKDEEMENLKIRMQLKEAELKSLQSRINPHFLFNSLNIICQLAYIEGAAQTSSLLESMTDMLRYNLDKFNKIVTIEDEIGNLKDYTVIQQKRYGNRIRFSIDVDEQIKACLIPCLVIQPLVENSIIHGVQNYTSNGFVGVEIKKQQDRVRIRVFDNGAGIEEVRLEQIRKELQGNNNDSCIKGIGLHNVYERLKLFFNNDVYIRISSIQKVETEIVFDIPIKFYEGDIECIN